MRKKQTEKPTVSFTMFRHGLILKEPQVEHIVDSILATIMLHIPQEQINHEVVKYFLEKAESRIGETNEATFKIERYIKCLASKDDKSL